MARDINSSSSASYGASISNQRVSKNFKPSDKFNIDVGIDCSAVAVTNGITFRLQDSYDGGSSWSNVGNQSEISPAAADLFDGTPTTGDVDAGTDAITLTGHAFFTGQKVYYSDAGGTAPTGLVDLTTYYVIYLTSNTISLASSQSNAFEGIAIDLTDDGAGASQSLQPLSASIRMIRDDATDLAQLPLQELCRVVVDTGASDSFTISKIYVRD